MTTQQTLDRVKQICEENGVIFDQRQLINMAIIYTYAQKDLLKEEMEERTK